MLIYCGRYLAYQTFVDAVSDRSVLERGGVTRAPGYGFPFGEKLMIIYCQGSGNQGGLAKTVETVLSQILEAQVTESLRADRYERSEEQQGYRNGYRARTLFARVGPATLQVPQT